ncbi:MAG: DUF2808 domain-containing protein [Tildeniella nuda ZEHNDER 1965/U140]|nr:DUF2808 domain-containing protein [Tildeniella nuda ZEHNDER 1965/U140]
MLSVSLVGFIGSSAQSVQLADGKTHFVQPPRFEGAIATQKTARFFGSTYYFTLTVPENAGESLQTVIITPEPAPDRVEFVLKQTEAFEGTSDREGAKLPLQTVTQDAKTQAIAVTFNPAVAAGKTVTIGLYATRNPDVGGTYLYGVTAFPTGAQASGQFLGYGRIQIYDGGQNSSLLPQRVPNNAS